MQNNKYHTLINSWDSTYQKTINKMDGFIDDVRNSQPEALGLVSPKNLGIFKQLMDLDIYFAEYMKYADSYAFPLTELLMNISRFTDDDSLKDLILNHIKPRIEEISKLFLNASKNYHDHKMKFDTEVFEYIEK